MFYIISPILFLIILLVYIWYSFKIPKMPQASFSGKYTLKNLHVIQPKRGSSLKDLHINEQVFDEKPAPKAQIINDFSGYYALPGLVDMHVHLAPANILHLPEYFSLLFLLNGVTTVRETGDGDGTSVPYMKNALQKGKITGPRVFSCGPYVLGGNPMFENYCLVKDQESVTKAVQRIKQEGHNFIKSYDYLSPELIDLIKKEGEKQNLPVIGHVPFGLSYEESGIPEVQHFHGVPLPQDLRRDHNVSRVADWQHVDESRMDEIVEYSIQNKIANTPTINLSNELIKFYNYDANLEEKSFKLMPRLYREVVWHPDFFPVFQGAVQEDVDFLKDCFPKKKKLLKKLFDAGADIFLGTDTQQPFATPGFATIEEFKVYVDSGIPLEDVWQIATKKAGKRLSSEKLGLLEAHAPADFLLFKENPIENIEAFSTLEAIVSNGNLFYKKDIEKSIKAFQKHHNKFLFDKLSVLVAKRKLKNIKR